MRKLFFILLILLFTSPSYAFIDIGWTGNSVSQANDTPPCLNYFHSPLGGPVHNSYIVFKAEEFTVHQQELIEYLFFDATVNPWDPFPNQPEYWEPQWMDVSFRLYDGGIYTYGAGEPNPYPGNLLAETSLYRFGSVDGHTSREYDKFQVPLRYALQPNEPYWLWVNLGWDYEGQASMDYKLAMGNTLVNPEPSTLLLFSIGLMGMITRRKCVRKDKHNLFCS